MKTMLISSLFQKLLQQRLYLTDCKLWRVLPKKWLSEGLSDQTDGNLPSWVPLLCPNKACGALLHQQVSMRTCLNKIGHNNYFLVVSPCWWWTQASEVDCDIEQISYWVFTEEFTFLSEISPPWHQDCVCSGLSETHVGLGELGGPSPLLYQQQRNMWLTPKVPSFHKSRAIICSACSCVRVSQERQPMEFDSVKSTGDLSRLKLNSV